MRVTRISQGQTTSRSKRALRLAVNAGRWGMDMTLKRLCNGYNKSPAAKRNAFGGNQQRIALLKIKTVIPLGGARVLLKPTL
jgi:hypothetical protein